MERGRPRSLPRTSTLHCSTAPLLPLRRPRHSSAYRTPREAERHRRRPSASTAPRSRRPRPRVAAGRGGSSSAKAVRRTARHTARNAKTARKRPDAQSERSPRQRGTTRAPLTPALPSESPRRPTKAPAWCRTLWRTGCHRQAPMRGRRRPSVGSARRRCALEARFRPAAARTAGARCRRDENGASGSALQHSQAPPPSSCNFTDPVEGIGVILLEG